MAGRYIALSVYHLYKDQRGVLAMTKDEIRIWERQIKDLKEAYVGQIDALKQVLLAKDKEIKELSRDNDYLREQVIHMQNGLTGEERDYYK